MTPKRVVIGCAVLCAVCAFIDPPSAAGSCAASALLFLAAATFPDEPRRP